MQTPSQSILAYFAGKDNNRPHLLRHAFDDSAVLEMRVNDARVSFPPLTEGRSAISDILVRRFALRFENVYSFCLCAPPGADARDLSCKWLVAMSEKEGGAVRVGCGSYRWEFCEQAPRLVRRMTIAIEHMPVLPPASLDIVMQWAGGLPYPWCPLASLLADSPPLPELAPVFDYLRDGT